MLMHPLPSINKVFFLLIPQECKQQIPLEENKTISQYNKTPFYGHTNDTSR